MPTVEDAWTMLPLQKTASAPVTETLRDLWRRKNDLSSRIHKMETDLDIWFHISEDAAMDDPQKFEKAVAIPATKAMDQIEKHILAIKSTLKRYKIKLF